MPEETLRVGIGVFKATDSDDRILLLDLTSDGVCGSLGSLLPGYVLFWLHLMVCTIDGGRSCSSRNLFAEYAWYFFFFLILILK